MFIRHTPLCRPPGYDLNLIKYGGRYMECAYYYDLLDSSLLICKSPFKSFEKLIELMKEAFEIFNSLPKVPRGDLQGAKRVG